MIRDRILEQADSVVGWTADPKGGSRQWYIDLIAPGEKDSMKASMVDMSGCGLTVAGLWRLAGIKHYKLDPPYIIGTGVSRLVTLARKVGAWVDYGADKWPSPADMVLVGDNGAGGVEHVYTVTGIQLEGTETIIESVDGGQRTDKVDPKTKKGYQAILAKRRVWRKGKDLVFSGSDPGATIPGGRKIYGWVNVDLLEQLCT